MSKPVLADLFCKAGGATRGYQDAGFYVVGVDIEPQPRYVGDEFVQGDALTFPLDGFDAIHASPPCQDWSATRTATGRKHGTAWMLPTTRTRLVASGLPYVIENVVGAPMPGALTLCGASFGLNAAGYALRRHRLFESNVFVMAPGCACPKRVAGVYGGGAQSRGAATSRRGGITLNAADSRVLMGIDWMTRDELTQAIPPAYTRFIGEQLLEHMGVGV